MPPRIAILFEYPTLNGGERSMLQVIDSIDPDAFEFVAIAPPVGRLAEALTRRSTRHVPIELRDAAGDRLSRETVSTRLVETVDMVRPNLVHANSLAMGRLTGAISERRDVPCAAHLRDIIKLSRAAIDDLNRNRLLIAVSEATRRYHADQGLDPVKTRVVYNGVDCDRFQPRPATGSLTRELAISRDAFIILTIGQIGLRKGQDVLADAAPLIVKQVPNAHFVLVGERNSSKAESVQYERNLVTRFESTGLGARLHRPGYRDDVCALLNAADLLVHPAKQEPLGRVLLEAAASGLPIVATSVGGTEEILADGESARLVPPGDAERIANAVIEMAHDERKRDRFALAAHERITTCFGARDGANRLTHEWHELLSRSRK